MLNPHQSHTENAIGPGHDISTQERSRWNLANSGRRTSGEAEHKRLGLDLVLALVQALGLVQLAWCLCWWALGSALALVQAPGLVQPVWW